MSVKLCQFLANATGRILTAITLVLVLNFPAFSQDDDLAGVDINSAEAQTPLSDEIEDLMNR